MAETLIAMGSNIEPRRSHLSNALDEIRQRDCRIVSQSRYYRSAAVGGPPGQADFLNAAIRIHSNLTAEKLLQVLLEIETTLGRQRDVRWGPRPIDLDLLLHGQQVIRLPHLTLPHPRLASRLFVLRPAAEVGGTLRHPTLGWTIDQINTHVSTRPARFVVFLPGRDQVASIQQSIQQSIQPPTAYPTPRHPKLAVYDAATTLKCSRQPLLDQRSDCSPPDLWKESANADELPTLVLQAIPTTKETTIDAWMDPSLAVRLAFIGVPTDASRRWAEAIEGRLRELGTTPWMRIQGDDPETIASDLVAAIVSSQEAVEPVER